MQEILEAIPFLSLNGKAQDAIQFYQKHFDAKVLFSITYEEMAKRDPSMILTEMNKNHISHSVLQIGRSQLMIAEESMAADRPYQKGSHFSLCIQSNDLNHIQMIYNRLLEDKEVRVLTPLGPNAFSKAYGIIEDPYHIIIQINHDPRLEEI